jgi:uncharacterized protein (DUF849 family)
MDGLIIDARLNEYTMRDRNPNVPWSPEEIGRAAAACREAGASIVHYHARDPETGAPSADPRLYAAAAGEIRARCDVLVMPTLGAGQIPDLDDRFAHVEVMAKDSATRADLVPLDLATTNLPILAPAGPGGGPALVGDDLHYLNTVGMLKQLAARSRAVGAAPMAAIWNVGSLRLLDALLATGAMGEPCYAELFCTEGGLLAGHPGTRRGLEAYLDFLPHGRRVEWAVACYGASALELAELAIERGGHVALGLGDWAYPELGPAPTNADVVAAVAALARRRGRPLATPAEVRAVLSQ